MKDSLAEATILDRGIILRASNQDSEAIKSYSYGDSNRILCSIVPQIH